MYCYINTRIVPNGCAVLARYDGAYHVDIFLSDGKAPVHSEAFPTVSGAKQWRESNARAYCHKQ